MTLFVDLLWKTLITFMFLPLQISWEVTLFWLHAGWDEDYRCTHSFFCLCYAGYYESWQSYLLTCGIMNWWLQIIPYAQSSINLPFPFSYLNEDKIMLSFLVVALSIELVLHSFPFRNWIKIVLTSWRSLILIPLCACNQNTPMSHFLYLKWQTHECDACFC